MFSGPAGNSETLAGPEPFAAERKCTMGLLRGTIAGIAAWKLGGGIISTILIFLLLYWLLGVIF
jgi:hypothetical protein